MKVARQPRVYLVGVQRVREPDLRRFLHDEAGAGDWNSDAPSDGEKLTEVGGRCCYDSFRSPRPGGYKSYIAHIKESGHGTIAEHAVYTFIFAGVSRNLSHELVRHRAGLSFSQRSTRYCDEADCAAVEPDEIAADPELHRLWYDHLLVSRKLYDYLTERLATRLVFSDEPTREEKTGARKRARQAARGVLPGCVETIVQATGNARAFRHFIEMRASRFADAEIRRLAVAVLEALQRASPELFGDYVLSPLPDGTREATTPYRKI